VGTIEAPSRRRGRRGEPERASLAVWAPAAERVEAILGTGAAARREPLVRHERGWWRLSAPLALPHGTRYAFALDGGQPLPDPRSPWQPDGVHGASCVVDHRLFPWTDAGFEPTPLAEAVLYELHVGTFTPAGTFESTIDRLDHLVEL